ncbi:hypothetical protein K438DRAFT_1789263 [Mycena galopus ATCC 62051]|nr:hypothetical protein K438DRAFT_1789263 [Mycena galopus ATCC 62051]
MDPINTDNASKELGKAEDLLKTYKKANAAAKNKLGGADIFSRRANFNVGSQPGINTPFLKSFLKIVGIRNAGRNDPGFIWREKRLRNDVKTPPEEFLHRF